MSVKGNKYDALTGGNADALDSKDGGLIGDGDIAIVTTGAELYIYKADVNSGAAEVVPDVIAPDNNPGDTRWILQKIPQNNQVPVGAIMPWLGCYFANSNNTGHVDILGDDVQSVNNYVNQYGWHVCDGSELNIAGSPLYNGSGRHLPQLTDDRFIMGTGGVVAVGGSNLTSHYHDIYIPALYTGQHTLSIGEIPSHSHQLQDSRESTSTHYHGATNLPNFASPPDGADPVHVNYSLVTGGGAGHSHYIPQRGVPTDPADNLENRPLFLACFYIQKVI